MVDSSRKWQKINGQDVPPDDQSDFIDWLITPLGERIPTTMKDWAEVRGLHPDTVKRWKRDPRFVEEWERRSREGHLSPENIDIAIHTLLDAAKNGDTKAAADFLRYAERMQPPPKKPASEDASTRSLSDEELAERLKATLGVEIEDDLADLS